MVFVAIYESMRQREVEPGKKTLQVIPGAEDEMLVEADDLPSAESLARRYQNIALYWTNGIGQFLRMRPAEAGDTNRLKTRQLASYIPMFPNR